MVISKWEKSGQGSQTPNTLSLSLHLREIDWYKQGTVISLTRKKCFCSISPFNNSLYGPSFKLQRFTQGILLKLHKKSALGLLFIATLRVPENYMSCLSQITKAVRLFEVEKGADGFSVKVLKWKRQIAGKPTSYCLVCTCKITAQDGWCWNSVYKSWHYATLSCHEISHHLRKKENYKAR